LPPLPPPTAPPAPPFPPGLPHRPALPPAAPAALGFRDNDMIGLAVAAREPADRTGVIAAAVPGAAARSCYAAGLRPRRLRGSVKRLPHQRWQQSGGYSTRSSRTWGHFACAVRCTAVVGGRRRGQADGPHGVGPRAEQGRLERGRLFCRRPYSVPAPARSFRRTPGKTCTCPLLLRLYTPATTTRKQRRAQYAHCQCCRITTTSDAGNARVPQFEADFQVRQGELQDSLLTLYP
jgi:hypothetical protein